jgi:hypothetical protein
MRAGNDGMKSHLLNWTLGPALLGAIFAAGGAEAPAGPALGALFALWRGFFGLAGFFVAFYLVSVLLQTIAYRLNEGRFIWTDVRTGATAMAVRLVLLMVTLLVLFTVREFAVIATGGWPKSVWAAAGGAVTAAPIGLLMGLGVARLQLRQRLGLDRGAGPTGDGTMTQCPAEPGAAPDRRGT